MGAGCLILGRAQYRIQIESRSCFHRRNKQPVGLVSAVGAVAGALALPDFLSIELDMRFRVAGARQRIAPTCLAHRWAKGLDQQYRLGIGAVGDDEGGAVLDARGRVGMLPFP